MGKMDKRNRRKNKLTSFIPLIIINICLIISNIILFHITKNNQLEFKNNISNYNNIIIENKNIESEITKIKNINTEIILAKENYYKTLKKFEDKVINKEVDYKIAYLTFDDGPYYLTHKFLNVLKDYDVRATFFTIGLNKEPCFDDNSKSCKDLYAKTASYGHTMANHTYSHQIFNGLYSSSNSFINSVKKQEKLIKEKTGITTNIVRFPGGSATAGNLKNDIIKKLRENGYGWVDWTASNGDGGYVPNKQLALSNFKKTINSDIEVILFHDYSEATLKSLPEVIEYLKEKNYILLPLFYESKMVNK